MSMSATLFGSWSHNNPDPIIYHVEYAAVDIPHVVFVHYLRLCVDKFGDHVLVRAVMCVHVDVHVFYYSAIGSMNAHVNEEAVFLGVFENRIKINPHSGTATESIGIVA